MRMNKLKGFNATARSLKHNFRDIETPNADQERSVDNIHQASGTNEAMGIIRDRLDNLDRKPRKDAVTCVEYLMTASPEWFASASSEQKETFFEGSRDWLIDKYGEENIASFSIHHDETTPHISAHVVPITKDGRLSAKELIGAKKQMQDDQTSFADKHHHIGLVRGVRGSKAVHQDIKAYYAEVNHSKEKEERVKERFYAAIPEKKMFESGDDYKQRVASNLTKEFSSLTKKASMTTAAARAEEKAKKHATHALKQNNALTGKNKELEHQVDDLKKEKELEEGKFYLVRDALVLSAGSKNAAQDIVDQIKNDRAEKKKLKEEEVRKEKSRSKGRGMSR